MNVTIGILNIFSVEHSKINIEENIILLSIEHIEKMTYFMLMNFLQKKNLL